MAFNGARVLSLESRRADEMATLIRKQGGEPFVAPSMREIELDRHEEASTSAVASLPPIRRHRFAHGRRYPPALENAARPLCRS